jgi:MbtH protein
MTGPFDDPDGSYTVLVNDEGQYSLWPRFAEVPRGWQETAAAGTRSACLAFVEERAAAAVRPVGEGAAR